MLSTAVAISVQAIRFVAAERIIFSQSMPIEITRQQDSTQVRMTVKDHSEEVVSLTLVPIGCFPKIADRRNMRVVLHDSNL